MVVLAASICTRGGKAVLSRQFREMQRSRVEALLASFPKLADAGTQHTTVEQDNVRFVYQPLDELYMVLITNRQSNILQDIDSLHLFAQVVTNICRSLDEREILRNAFELLSAFDEIINLGYRENLTLTQIKTFLDMESHEERIALIIEANKQAEASDYMKGKAKELKELRERQARASRGQMQRPPQYPSYTASMPTTSVDPTESYAAEKNKSYSKTAPVGKGMQLGKKSKSANVFEQVRSGVGAEEADAPLITPAPAQQTVTKAVVPEASSGERQAIHVTISEGISAQISREGVMESFEVKGELQLRIADPSLAQIKLNLVMNDAQGIPYQPHPNCDKAVFNSTKVIQLKDSSRGFPAKNTPVNVTRWRHAVKSGDATDLPLTLTAWVNPGSDDTFSITVEYELSGGGDTLRDVSITIPFGASEPSVSSFDAVYEVSGDTLEWTVGTIDADNPNGSFEFEAQADSDDAFFPMTVRFAKTSAFAELDVASVTLLNMNQDLPFSKEVKSTADNYRMV